MIQIWWYRKSEAIIGVKIGNADADSYKYEPMTALLDWWETTEKDNKSKHCNNKRKMFSQ